MAALLLWVLALAGFTFGFAIVWFSFLNLSLALLFGLLAGGGVFLWVRRLAGEGPAPWALERLAMRLAARRGSVSAKELSQAAGIPEDRAREVLDGLRRRGLAERSGERYTFKG